MSIDATQQPQALIAPEWTPPPPPTDLIFDDGEPLATNRHRIAMNVLIRSVQQVFSDRTDFFVGGNMFVYYSENQSMNRDFRGSDFFVVLTGTCYWLRFKLKNKQDSQHNSLRQIGNCERGC